jgi:hypothetical protein
MVVKTDFAGLTTTRWHEYAIRFAVGGAITVIAGLITRKWGPGIGGLFLAFPAIFPAGGRDLRLGCCISFGLASSEKMPAR